MNDSYPTKNNLENLSIKRKTWKDQGWLVAQHFEADISTSACYHFMTALISYRLNEVQTLERENTNIAMGLPVKKEKIWHVNYLMETRKLYWNLTIFL